LLEWGFGAFQAEELVPEDAVVGQARVQGGADMHVALRPARAVMTSVAQGSASKPTLTVRYRGPVEAPVAEGQPIGVLRVSTTGQASHDVPLVAARAVARANWIQRLRNGLVGIFA
jgi:D-alanyl-D-alanine carboxypeptidase (penicillin-binding protein 5/6)